MITQIMKRFGWKLERIDPALAPLLPLQKLHDLHRDRFDHEHPEIHHGPWGSTYYENNILRVAIGRDGWVPLYVILATLSEEGSELMRKEFADLYAFQIPQQERNSLTDELHPPTMESSWIDANRSLFNAIQLRDQREELGYDSLSSYVIGVRFSHLRKAARPMELRGFMAVSEAHARLHDEPAIRSMREASKAAMTYFDGVSVSWLQARGHQVDVERHLVKLDGYQPLYRVDEFAIYE